MIGSFNKVVVCGAGVMGAQIAAHLANVGCSVALLDLPAEGADRNARANGAIKQMLKMKPAPFDGKEASTAIQAGNFEDHLNLIRGSDWVIEAVIENLEIKRGLLKNIADQRQGDTLVSTNTSGIPLRTLCEGFDEEFLKHFFGVHFFNPPRYLKLLEIIPGEKTNAALLKRFCEFGRIHLGKGVVMAKDTPNFIGNRIGIYTMCQAMQSWLSGEYTLEEIESLTGPLLGRPKSATFRTTDVVGLDTFVHVANNLYEAVEKDDEQSIFECPEVVRSMIEKGLLGAKVGKGFYAKVGREIKVINTQTWDYDQQKEPKLSKLEQLSKERNLSLRLQALYNDDSKVGQFVRSHLQAVFAYSAKRIPEISDVPESVDLAMKFGFGWQMGPFEMWDAIGFEQVLKDLVQNGFVVPPWLEQMQKNGHASFTKVSEVVTCYHPIPSSYEPEQRACDEWNVADLRRRSSSVVADHEAATLFDIGDGVALLSFKTKANAFNAALVEACQQAIFKVLQDDRWKGLVMANDGDLFSAGADLSSIIQSVQKGDLEAVEKLIADFQQLGQLIRYASKPVVLSAHGRALGGGLEMLMSSPHAIVTGEMYVGLVELGVGVIPAGGGCLRLLQSAMERGASNKAVDVAPFVEKHFLAIAQASVSSGTAEAKSMGFLNSNLSVVRHADRRMEVAKAKVLYLNAQGYQAPRPGLVLALGAPGYAKLMVMVRQYVEAGFASEYDAHLCSKVAKIMTGGELASAKMVPEKMILDLEVKAFMSLLGEKKTHERIESMLVHKKPLRN
jgi:3-hydroxyacyl-CoA dehydrogenase